MTTIHRLEVENFKSYAGKQQIGPFKQFTAVIGPNGAGKSNLMDAISFVLGEDSKTLRGTNLLDLVNKQHLDSKKSIRAFVELVLKTDDTEVRFRRSITSAGAAEYRVDGEVKGKEAYTHRLEEFNILVQARNCLVFQGDVEAVAARSAKELTALIEQVSGSAALQEEYETLAEQRLKLEEDVRFNFKKKKGIGAEKKQYKEQKTEAEKFQKLEAELAQTQLENMILQLFYISTDIEATAEQRTKAEDELVKVQHKAGTTEKALKEKDQALAKAQQDLKAHQKSLQKKKGEFEKKQPELFKKRQEIDHLHKRIDTAEKEAQTLTDEADKQKEKVDQLKEELKGVEKEEKEFDAQIKKSAKDFATVLSPEHLAELSKIKATAVTETAKARQALAQTERAQQTDVEALERHKLKNTELDGQFKKLTDEKEALVKRKETVDSVHGETLTKLTQLRQELDQTTQDNQANKDRQAELSEDLRKVQDTLREAKNASKETQRDTRFKETLQSLKRLFPGVHGRILDLVEVSNKNYQIALTVVLGGHMDSIVVADEKTAMDCIRYMKDQRIGVATFLPLDTLQGKAVDDILRSLAAKLGAKPIIDVLKYDAIYQRILEYVCGNTMVCDSLDAARKLAFKQSKRHRVVTIDGTLIQKSGLMTGGISGVEAKSARWGEKEIENVKQRRDKLVAELTELTAATRSFAKEQLLLAQIATLESRLKFAKYDQDITKERLTKTNGEIKKIETELTRLRSEMDKLTDAIETRKEEIQAEQTKIKEAENKLYKGLSDRLKVPNIRDYEDRHVQWQKEKTDKLLAFRKLKSQIENLMEYERTRDLGAAVTAVGQRLAADRKARDSSVAQLKKIEAEVDSSKTDLAALEKETKKAGEVVAERDTELRTLRKAQETLQKMATQASKEMSVAEDQLDKLRERRHGLYVRSQLDQLALPLHGEAELPAVAAEEDAMDTSDLDTDARKDKLAEEDEISVDFTRLSPKLRGARNAAQRDETLTHIAQKIQSMQAEMEKLAPNLKAIERLDEVTKRMTETKDQLEETKKQAREVITQFNKVKQQRQQKFTKAFDHISGSIDKIYRELTSGNGMAFLTLDSVEEPYLGGVRFSAVPPSKTYRSIDQLSGGEKTVAALALLFAIHSFKPAPFFVLDEVDAALDKHNVERVATYFKEKAQAGAQFVLISLKDTVYSKADSLVGIYIDTAQDCSKTLTLDLARYAQEFADE